MRRGKNIQNKYITKAILSVESELKIMYLQVGSSNTTNILKIKNCKLLNWDITDNDIIELSRALFATQKATYEGKTAKFIEIERSLERFFNKSVNRPHNKVTRIGDRVNISPFLDKLKESYLRDFELRL